MRIAGIRTRTVRVPLTRPYSIAGGSWDQAEFVVVEIEASNGMVGFGHASPAVEVTGEDLAACEHALDPRKLAWVTELDARDPRGAAAIIERRIPGPAARAAIDGALFDLDGRIAGVPVVARLGRVHDTFPTSITIGVKDTAATVAEASEYLTRGFRALKVKTGVDVDDDIRRLTELRRTFGPHFLLRVDANQGWGPSAMETFLPHMDPLAVEILEQPCAPADDDRLRALPASIRRRIIADESVHDIRDLERLAGPHSPFGGINVKLMKCGGIAPALRLAKKAGDLGLSVMWGCMDESVAGIAAALHAALASPATRYLDLDGSLDLGEDPFIGGFDLRDGCLHPLATPGLGIRPS